MKFNRLKILLLTLFLPVSIASSSCGAPHNNIISFSFDSSFSFDKNTKIFGNTVKIFEKNVMTPTNWKDWYVNQEITSQSFLFDLCYTINQKCKENEVISKWKAKVSFDIGNFNRDNSYTFEYSIAFSTPQTSGIFANIDFYKEKINNYDLKFINNNSSKNILNFEWSENKDEKSWVQTEYHRFDTNLWVNKRNTNLFTIKSFVLNNQDATSYSEILFKNNLNADLKIFRFSFSDKDILEENFINYFNNSEVYFKKSLLLNLEDYLKDCLDGGYHSMDYVKQISISAKTSTPWTEVAEIHFYDFVKINNKNDLVVENCKIVNSSGI